MRGIAILLLAAAVPLTAGAAGTMKPGLWEVSMKSDAARDMPKIPPEKLAKLREMGIDVPQMQDGAMTHRICITKEMAEQSQTPDVGHQSDCKVTNHDKSGDSYKVDLSCDGPNLKGQGTIKGKMSGGERFSSTYDFAGTSRGRDVTMHNESSGRWIGADCGSVKPAGEMMKDFKKK